MPPEFHARRPARTPLILIVVLLLASCGSERTGLNGDVYNALSLPEGRELVQLFDSDDDDVSLVEVGGHESTDLVSAVWVEAYGLSPNGLYLAVAFGEIKGNFLSMFRSDGGRFEMVSTSAIEDSIGGTIQPTDDGGTVYATVLADPARGDASNLVSIDVDESTSRRIPIPESVGAPSYLGRLQLLDGNDTLLVGGSPSSSCALIEVELSNGRASCAIRSAGLFDPGVVLADHLGRCKGLDLFATYTSLVPSSFAVIAVGVAEVAAPREIALAEGLRPRFSCSTGQVSSAAPDFQSVSTITLEL